MGEPLWRGVGAALITLFDGKLEVDYQATAAHAVRLVESGIQAILVAGTTGEADALTEYERHALVAAVKAAVPGTPVIAGASGAWAGQSAERIRGALEANADAVLVAPPRRCSNLRGFYQRVGAAARNTPVLAYHFPGVAGGEVPVDALPSLPIAGLKDSTGDATRLMVELSTWDRWTYVGSAALATLAGVLGAPGALLAIANAEPELAIGAFAGDADAQRRLVVPVRETMTRFPHGIKSLTGARFGTAVHARIG